MKRNKGKALIFAAAIAIALAVVGVRALDD